MHFVQANPINNLAKELGKDPKWQSGIVQVIMLPESTPTKDLVAAYFENNIDYKGKIKDWEIYKEEKVQIPKGYKTNFKAVWCATEFGGRTILFQFEPRKSCWWNRGYDAKYFFSQNLYPEKAEQGAASNHLPRGAR
jgi:hypothetical protein